MRLHNRKIIVTFIFFIIYSINLSSQDFAFFKLLNSDKIISKAEVSFFFLNNNINYHSLLLFSCIGKTDKRNINSEISINKYFSKQSIEFVREEAEWTLQNKVTAQNDINNKMNNETYAAYNGTTFENNIEIMKKSVSPNNLNEIRIRKWDKDRWSNSERILYSRDADNKLSEIIILDWNNNKWVNSKKITYSYNHENNISEEYLYFWNGYTWIDNMNFSCSYYMDGKPAAIIQKSNSNGTWIPKNKYILTEHNSYSEITEQRYKNDNWDNNAKLIHKYSTIENITESSYYKWENGIWSNQIKSEFIYNKKEQLNCEVEYSGNKENWQKIHKTEYIYDENGLCLESSVQAWKDNNWNDYKKTINRYDLYPSSQIALKLEIQQDYDLSQQNTDPANLSTTIQYFLPENNYVTLKIFNTLGQVINTLVDNIQQKGIYSFEWNRDNLPQGIYYYKLQFGNYTSVNKMLCFR